jgi:N-acetyl-anhydromuramyl-L-alanine amidase AmpD
MFVALAILSALTLSQPADYAAGYADPGRNNVAWYGSPHFNERPPGTVIDTIVLHHTANSTLRGVVSWFRNPASRVSAHFTVGKDGSIVQHVSTFVRAWHAGPSVDKFGRSDVNDFSVGIEIVNLGDGKDPWTPEQVDAVRFLVGHLARHRFPIRQIVSHEFIARPTGRKVDPKNYPWESLADLGIELVYGVPSGSAEPAR